MAHGDHVQAVYAQAVPSELGVWALGTPSCIHTVRALCALFVYLLPCTGNACEQRAILKQLTNSQSAFSDETRIKIGQGLTLKEG